MIGKLERLPLREVWKHEALDFTKWLEENADVLSDEAGFTLCNIEREKSVGSFSVDLVGEDDSGNSVIIENQLEKSDHDHLGKLLTYLSAVEAKTAIWIVAEPRPEHVKAVAWLNDSSSASFFLLKVEAVRIGNSSPAPLLTLIVGPSEDSSYVSETKREMGERHVNRKRFWVQLLDELSKRGISLHANRSPGIETWISTGAGRSGLEYSYVIRMNDAQVELYIDRGKGCETENEVVFHHFQRHRNDIETAFGAPLTWQDLPGKRAFRIAFQIAEGGLKNEELWPRIQAAMIDGMTRLHRALSPFVDSLSL